MKVAVYWRLRVMWLECSILRDRYTLEELKKRPLPEGVDPQNLENYLSADDMQVGSVPTRSGGGATRLEPPTFGQLGPFQKTKRSQKLDIFKISNVFPAIGTQISHIPSPPPPPQLTTAYTFALRTLPPPPPPPPTYTLHCTVSPTGITLGEASCVCPTQSLNPPWYLKMIPE